MRRLAVEPSDMQLVEAASSLLVARFRPARHHVAAAFRTGRGQVVTGVHVGSRRVNVCAEQVALGTALGAGHEQFVAGAAVIMMEADDMPVVTSPCGLCRELLGTWAPDMTVLVDDDGTVVKTYVRDLLPAPWLLPAETSHAPLLSPITSNEEAHESDA